MEYGLTNVVSDIGTVFNGAIEWVGTVATTIVDNPILLFFTLVGFTTMGIGLYKSLAN